MPIVPDGAQSINLDSEPKQESESNQVRVKLDAENLHKLIMSIKWCHYNYVYVI